MALIYEVRKQVHIYAAVPQILGVSVSLTAVTDYGNSEIFEEFFVAVVVIVHLAHFLFPFLLVCCIRALFCLTKQQF